MVHEEGTRGKKPKGFQFGNQYGRGKRKIENDILADQGHDDGNRGEIIEPESAKNVEEIKEEPIIKETEIVLATTKIDLPSEKPETEIIEEIHFKEGENTLTLRFSKRQNRTYRMQVFLNDSVEIKPVNYNGASTGLTYWRLLKNLMNK